MPALKNTKHEAFAVLIFQKRNAVQAYREVYGKKRGERTTASRLLANAGIAARVKELMGQATSAHILTKREEMEFLTRVVLTSPDQVGPESNLAQSYSKEGEKITVKLPDKLRAIELLAKMKAEFPQMEQPAAPAPAVNVNVSVAVMTEDRRQELLNKKQQAIQRRLAAKATTTNGNGHN